MERGLLQPKDKNQVYDSFICSTRAVATGGALGAAAPRQFALPSGPKNYIDALKKNKKNLTLIIDYS